MASEKSYNRQIGAAYWFVTHKEMLKTISSVFLITVGVIILAINVYLLIFNLGFYGSAYKGYLNSFSAFSADYINFRQYRLPQPLGVNQIFTLPNSNKYDIIAEISNPSPYWYATFKYRFQLGGDELTDARPGYILPGQSKRLVDLNVESGNSVSDLIFSDLKWIKEINYLALAKEKFDVEVKNIVLITPSQLGLGDKVQISRVTFDVANNSPFNYANVSLQIYLSSGGQIQAANQIYSGALKTGETKSYQVNFFQPLPKITDISIIPEINILDPDSFLKF